MTTSNTLEFDSRIIDGRRLAREMRPQLIREAQILSDNNVIPTLRIIRVGDDPASAIYVRNKLAACSEIGISAREHVFPADVNEYDVISQICDLNRHHDVHAIIVQLPLPSHHNREHVLSYIETIKDVDCFTPENLGRLVHGVYPEYMPCTPSAIKYVLDKHIDTVGAHIVIINDTIVVGRPLSMLLLNHGATVTVCNSSTCNLREIAKTADVVVTAVGKRPHFVLDSSYVREGTVVVDVGISRLSHGICGDAQFDELLPKVKLITPMPGGVGPLTVSMLLRNTILAASKQ